MGNLKPAFRRLIAEAEADVGAGRVVTWRQFLKSEQLLLLRVVHKPDQRRALRSLR